MSEIITDIKRLQAETIDNLKSSKARNTIRAYKSDIFDFIGFCNRHSLKFLPADPNVVSLYLTSLSKYLKFSTLKRRIASISMYHKTKGHYLDTKHPIISENLLGIKRIKGSIQKVKKPILINELKLIINEINKDSLSELEKLKNRTLILIGFSGGFRRSELADLKLNDIEFVNEGVKINIGKSKNDQFREGQIKAIPYFKKMEYCPVMALKEWIKFKKSEKKTLFECSDKMISLIIKKYIKLIGLDNKDYSGHSLRSGFATSTAGYGADERSIMAMTGHKSAEMVRRYIREANLFKNNPLDSLNK